MLAPDTIRILWQGSRFWTAAAVLLGFPLLFIIDEHVQTPLSPVLPGLAVLLLGLLGLPFLAMELQARRYLRHDRPWRVRHGRRFHQSSKLALGLSAAALLAWFALGA